MIIEIVVSIKSEVMWQLKVQVFRDIENVKILVSLPVIIIDHGSEYILSTFIEEYAVVEPDIIAYVFNLRNICIIAEVAIM